LTSQQLFRYRSVIVYGLPNVHVSVLTLRMLLFSSVGLMLWVWKLLNRKGN